MDDTYSTNESKATLLAVVPTSIYEECSVASHSKSGHSANSNQIFVAEFNVAVWLRFNIAPTHPTSVWLNYTDAKGTRKVFVDKGILNASKHLMLSAKVAIRFRGAISHMTVTCSGQGSEKDKVIVDELYVQAVNKARSISNTISSV